MPLDWPCFPLRLAVFVPSVCVAPLPRCLSPRIERHRGLFPRVATDLLVTHLTCLPLARA